MRNVSLVSVAALFPVRDPVTDLSRVGSEVGPRQHVSKVRGLVSASRHPHLFPFRLRFLKERDTLHESLAFLERRTTPWWTGPSQTPDVRRGVR